MTNTVEFYGPHATAIRTYMNERGLGFEAKDCVFIVSKGEVIGHRPPRLREYNVGFVCPPTVEEVVGTTRPVPPEVHEVDDLEPAIDEEAFQRLENVRWGRLTASPASPAGSR